MKFYCLNILFLLIFSSHPKCQYKIKADSNFLYFDHEVKEFKIDNCLIDLLTTIEQADSNHLNFPPQNFFYDLTFEIREDRRYMMVSPSRWMKSATLDFSGVIVVGQMFFLCRGDINQDSLFVETKNKINISLRKPKLYQYDSVDVMIETFTWKPSLAVSYGLCQGKPIDLFVLVGKKLGNVLE